MTAVAATHGATLWWAARWVVAAIAAAAIAAALALVAQRLLRRSPAASALARRGRWSFAIFAGAVVLRGAAAGSPHHGAARTAIVQAASVLVVAAVTWLAVHAVHIVGDLVVQRFDVATPDNRRARSARTQIAVTRRVVTAVLAVFGLVVALRALPWARELGTGLLASASVLGAILGFTARTTIGNLIAGLQIAFSDLLRFDDAVVVENEWGRVEEITLTYVVVALWDERRLTLPSSYFVEKPFQNWTRRTAELLGPVELWVDYSTDIDALRAELDRIVQSSSWWDGRSAVVHVTGASPHALKVRALVSAASAGDAWELRCEVRERLARWLASKQAVPPPVRVDTGEAVPGRGRGSSRSRREGATRAGG